MGSVKNPDYQPNDLSGGMAGGQANAGANTSNDPYLRTTNAAAGRGI